MRTKLLFLFTLAFAPSAAKSRPFHFPADTFAFSNTSSSLEAFPTRFRPCFTICSNGCEAYDHYKREQDNWLLPRLAKV